MLKGREFPADRGPRELETQLLAIMAMVRARIGVNLDMGWRGEVG